MAVHMHKSAGCLTELNLHHILQPVCASAVLSTSLGLAVQSACQTDCAPFQSSFCLTSPCLCPIRLSWFTCCTVATSCNH